MNALIKKLEQEKNEDKKDITLKVTKEKKDKKKKVVDSSDEDGDDEVALLVKTFTKF